MSDEGHRHRILIVEDDVRAALTLSQLLREDGYDVEVANDGASAMDRLSRAPSPDVLLADYRLPHVDGLAVAAYGRAHNPALRVVMVTSYTEILRNLGGEFANASVLVVGKPVAYGELARQIQTILAAP